MLPTKNAVAKMNPMDDPADRPAPGQLAVVQAFLNAPLQEPTFDELQLGDELRRLAAIGESQAALAARFGISQQLVSAALRERRLAGPPNQSLASPSTSAGWLRAQGFEAGPGPLSEADHQRIRQLRDALHALTFANNGGPQVGTAVEALNRIASDIRLGMSFAPDGASAVEPRGTGAGRFIETVLLAVHEAQRDGTWPRLKACPADRCEHVFYDASRNRTATWCSMAICGNRAKVRNYQERRRAGIQPRQT